MIESGIDDEVFSHWVRDGPEISYSVAIGERLGEVPQLTSQGEGSQRMGDGERLAELSAADGDVGLLGEDSVYVKVEAAEVFAEEKERALPEGADVDFGGWRRVEPANIAEAYGGRTAFAG